MQRVPRSTFDGLPRTAMYMDDVGQGATTVRKALDLLNEALRRVVINGLKMDLRKCQLIQDKVSFLGYVIFAEGRTLDESRVAAVEKFEPHRNAKKLYSFLQFANHYRKFILEFAKVTHKLRHLLTKDVPFVWTDAHEATVHTIKHALKNPPILASFRPDCPTNVHVDASQTGLVTYASFKERDTDCKRFREEAKPKSSDYEIENDILVKKSLEEGRVRGRVVIPAAL
ncbi:hypothetical protein MRX96_037503 [Rhipicephalus microplus]